MPNFIEGEGEVRGAVKKKRSIFKDIVQIGGREVNPISKKIKRNDFLTKVGEGGGAKHIVKNKNTLFCMIYYSIWSNQGTLCLFVCTSDPQKEIGIIVNVSFTALNFMIFVKNFGEGGRST